MSKLNQQTWKDKVPICFGDPDLLFALHPSDEACAKEMITAGKAGASSDVILSVVRDYLMSKDETTGAHR